MISAARRAIVERQEKVSEMVRAGLSTTQIAQELKVTERTVQRDRHQAIHTCEDCGIEDANSTRVHYVLTLNGMRWMCGECIQS